MSGPDPKAKDERRRRNKPKSGEWVVLSESYDGPIPELPRIQHFTWKKATKDWWKSIWRSVMATQWQESDVFGLVEIALLRQEFLEGDYRLATPLTAKSDKFGLTPKGRKDLRWVVTEEDAESAGVKSKGGKLAPVRRLRAVDGEGA